MIRTKNRYYFILFPFLLLLSGCIGTQHLKENERLLYKQKIKAPNEINTDELNDLYAQEANRKVLGMPVAPLVWIHYLGKRNFDPEKYKKKIAKAEKKYNAKIAKAKTDKKINNLQFRKQGKIAKYNDRIQNGNQFMQWGEPITVFDSSALNLTVERFKEYLFTNGYFLNNVTPKATTITKLVTVKYTIEPGKRYVLDTIFYNVSDSAILFLLMANQKNCLLRKGEGYSQDNFTKERERIDLLLKDNGYFDFSRQYVEFNIDTTHHGDKKVAVQIVINDPAKRNKHKKFYIEEINFITDAGVSNLTIDRQLQNYRDINYRYYEPKYNLKILSQRVFISPGSHYSRQSTFDTQRQLSNLNNFKFVNINYDTTGGRFVANIYTSALDRYQWSNEVGLSVTQGFPGPFYNLNFTKRNIFRGLENFEMNGRIGYEGVAAATSVGGVYQSVEASINASLTFPQFLLPLSEDARYRLARVNPKTKIQVGYTYTDRPEYIRGATSVNYTYSWENQRIKRYDLTLASLSVINSDTDPTFQDFLQEQYDSLGNTLIYSFRPSFVSSMIFSMTWNHNNYGSPDQSSAFIRWSIESGGTMQNIIEPKLAEKRNLQTFKYVRINVDTRRINVLNKTTTVAYRFNAGVGYSYDSTGVLPYEKYFFAGGSNSVRAWRPRRLGPGSFKPAVSSNIEKNGYFNYQFEQPGDILIEASVELRKKLFGFVEGAIFVDAGNVWTFKPREKMDENGNIIENGNSEFKANQFLRELGVGTGFGFRFNFSFLILRFDVGMKVYDPARDEGSRFVLDGVRFWSPYSANSEPVIYNIGIGYPF
ncbi:MAG: BamA/TamA family outer membrane protein [Cyclobacteriaceae bacterium]